MANFFITISTPKPLLIKIATLPKSRHVSFGKGKKVQVQNKIIFFYIPVGDAIIKCPATFYNPNPKLKPPLQPPIAP